MTAPPKPERRTRPAILKLTAVVAVLAVAALLRLWALGRPGQLVFDELYYVRDAISQLAHGFPTTWPSDDPAFGGELARSFSGDAASIAHPPLGKWLIGLGVLLLGVDGAGVDTGWGWRIAVALVGVATVALTMRLAWRISRSVWIACCAGLLLAVDGVHVVLSRVALLDGFLTFFVVLGALCVWRDQESALPAARRPLRDAQPVLAAQPVQFLGSQPAEHPPPVHASAANATMIDLIHWRRPWLLAAGLAFGAAAAVKWSGVYPLAAFLLLITARDVILRLRIAKHPWLSALRQAVVTASIALPAAFLAYLASWIGWIINPGGQYHAPGEPWWVALWQWHAHTLQWHATLTADHPYRSSPLGWPLGLRPTGMHWQSIDAGPDCPWRSGCVAVVSSLPNPLVTWGGVLALALLAWVVIRAIARADLRAHFGSAIWAAVFVLVGYLAGWLPWVLTFSRSAVFQFYAVVLTPFSALALALVLGALCTAKRGGDVVHAAGFRPSTAAGAVQGRRIAVAVYLLAAVALAALFFPLWSGMPVATWFWRAHVWLPGWV